MTRDEALKKMQAVKSYMTSGNPIWSVTEIGEAFDMAIEALEQPERKKGEWVRLKKDLAKCSACEDYIDNAISCGYNYCPNCGAEMRGEEDVDND